jgi:hypothetical protein
MSYTRGEQNLVEVETNWFYTSKENMNTAILEDFNKISLDIQDFPRDIDDDEYIKVKTNKYLNKEKIKEIPNYSPNFRGPLVFFASGIETQSQNGTLLNDKFELTFGINTYEDTFADGKFGEDYFFNTTEFFKSKLDE